MTQDATRVGAGPTPDRLTLAALLTAILALTIYRLVLGVFDQTELSTDEAQYWVWGQALDFGAYSKPPLIGWIMRASTELLGQSVAAVRLPAALMHGATALILFGIARRLGSARMAWIAALSYLTTPAVTLGSAVMTTDTPMLLAAALALAAQLGLADARAEGRRATGLAIGLGLALGLGILAKHAMLFWLAGAICAAWVSPRFRVRWGDAALAGAVLLAVILPHLLWLARHDFVTLHHVRAITAGHGLSLVRPLRFLAEQAIVLGPILWFALGLAALRGSRDGPMRALVVLALVPVLIVLVQAIRGPVLANWAVLYLVPGAILAGFWLERHSRLTWLSLALGLAVALALPLLKVAGTGMAGPNGQPVLARYLGHQPVADWVLETGKAAGAGTLVASERSLLADLSWFGAGSGLVLRAVPPLGPPAHHWEASAPFRAEADPTPVLLLWPEGQALPCGDAAPLSRFTAPDGAYGGRSFALYRLEQPECLAARGASHG